MIKRLHSNSRNGLDPLDSLRGLGVLRTLRDEVAKEVKYDVGQELQEKEARLSNEVRTRIEEPITQAAVAASRKHVNDELGEKFKVYLTIAGVVLTVLTVLGYQNIRSLLAEDANKHAEVTVNSAVDKAIKEHVGAIQARQATFEVFVAEQQSELGKTADELGRNVSSTVMNAAMAVSSDTMRALAEVSAAVRSANEKLEKSAEVTERNAIERINQVAGQVMVQIANAQQRENDSSAPWRKAIEMRLDEIEKRLKSDASLASSQSPSGQPPEVDLMRALARFDTGSLGGKGSPSEVALGEGGPLQQRLFDFAVTRESRPAKLLELAAEWAKAGNHDLAQMVLLPLMSYPSMFESADRMRAADLLLAAEVPLLDLHGRAIELMIFALRCDPVDLVVFEKARRSFEENPYRNIDPDQSFEDFIRTTFLVLTTPADSAAHPLAPDIAAAFMKTVAKRSTLTARGNANLLTMAKLAGVADADFAGLEKDVIEAAVKPSESGSAPVDSWTDYYMACFFADALLRTPLHDAAATREVMAKFLQIVLPKADDVDPAKLRARIEKFNASGPP